MSEVERLQAAIDLLTEIREAPNYYPDYMPELGTAEDFNRGVKKIVVLLRTIDAQIAVLAGEIRFLGYNHQIHSHAHPLALADAILGAAS